MKASASLTLSKMCQVSKIVVKFYDNGLSHGVGPGLKAIHCITMPRHIFESKSKRVLDWTVIRGGVCNLKCCRIRVEAEDLS